MGKDLTEVRSLQRKLVPDNVGLGQCEQTSLRGITIKAKANGKHRFQDLYRCLNAPFLYTCWKGLNKNAASGVDKVTAEAYEENLVGNILKMFISRIKIFCKYRILFFSFFYILLEITHNFFLLK